jgi:hypothetical protein
VWWLPPRRKRRQRLGAHEQLEAAAAAREASDRQIAELLLERVDAFHVLEGTSSDVIDAKATGLLVADTAVGTILVAAHGDVGPAWIAPAFGLAVAAWFLMRVIRRRDWDYGPDLDKFLTETDGVPAITAITKMASDMQKSWQINAVTVKRKGDLFHVGYHVMYWSLILGLALAAIHTFV